MGYTELDKLYENNRLDVFCMATSHLMDIGWRTAEEMSDKDIEKQEGNGIMTKEFVQDLLRLTKEIARATGPSELIMFCSVKDIFDVKWYANRLRRYELEDALESASNYLLSHGYSYDDTRDIFGLDDEDMYLLGLNVEDDEDELEAS